MNALEELKRLIDIESITTITTHSASLSIKETLELMDEVDVNNLNTDLTFWTKDEKVVVYETEDDWGTEIELVRVSFKPSKSLIKGTPESVTDVWQDPKSGRYVPFKTKSYHEKEKSVKEARDERAKENERRLIRDLNSQTERNKVYFENLPSIKDEPFTIIKGGDGDNCRYITLPKDFPFSKITYGLMGDFYSNIDSELRRVIDFSGIAANVNDDLKVVGRYVPSVIKENHSDSRKEAFKKHDELYETLENNGKIVKVVGFCIETLSYRKMGTLDEVAEKLREELRALDF